MQKITILGAGLVGSLLAIFLKKKGFEVEIFEKRPDARLGEVYAGRSINLALSHRGWSALQKVGLAQKVNQIAIPMYGRMIHTIDEKTHVQPYSLHDATKAIYSISRAELNKLLLTEAESFGARIHFNTKCTKIEIDNKLLGFRNLANEYIKITNPVCISADGAFSLLRSEIIKQDKVNYSQTYLEHGYQEFHIPSGENNTWQMEKNALHIWPRESFMLIALPNLDGSFTCTLFLQNEGNISFQKLKNKSDYRIFFQTHFKDALDLIPNFELQAMENPVSSLATMKVYPWFKSNFCLMGDAAHAIVPFYGQGMNCGFEDIEIFDSLLQKSETDFEKIFEQFQQLRKPNTDAIAQMALDNFLEMRDLVTDEHFLNLKKIESNIIKKYPEKWISQYEMVTFSSLPYADALKKGIENKQKLTYWLQNFGTEYVPLENEL